MWFVIVYHEFIFTMDCFVFNCGISWTLDGRYISTENVFFLSLLLPRDPRFSSVWDIYLFEDFIPCWPCKFRPCTRIWPRLTCVIFIRSLFPTRAGRRHGLPCQFSILLAFLFTSQNGSAHHGPCPMQGSQFPCSASVQGHVLCPVWAWTSSLLDAGAYICSGTLAMSWPSVPGSFSFNLDYVCNFF